MKATLLCLVIALVSTLPATAQEAGAVAIVGVTVLPLDGPAVLADRTVILRHGVIERIGPRAAVDVPVDARRIDGAGRYLVPGLTDSHYHLYNPRDLGVLLAHGVTTILNQAGSPMHLDLKRAIASGEIAGPTMYTTGPQLKDAANPAIDTERNVASVADARMHVSTQALMGYDFVKPWSGFTADIYAAIADEAHRNGIRMLGHVPRSVGLSGIAAAGQSIAHVEEFYNKHFDRNVDDAGIPEAVATVVGGGVAVVTTLITYEMIARTTSDGLGGLLERPGRQLVDPVRQLLWEPQFNEYRGDVFIRRGTETYRTALGFKQRITLALQRAGVPLLAGTDAGMLPGIVPGEDLHRELELLVEAGLTPLEALQSATRTPGAFLDPAEPFGTLIEGARADLLLLDGNPFEDISNTRSVRAVVSRGRYFDRAELDGFIAGVAIANARTGRFVQRVLSEGVPSARVYVDSLRAAGDSQPAFDAMPGLILGYALAGQGDLGAAIDLLGLVAAVHPDEYWAPYMRAGARLGAGDLDGARSDYLRVLEIRPGHPEARRRLDAPPLRSGGNPGGH